MSNIEEYFQKYREDMVNFVEGKVRRQVNPTGDIYDTIANLIAKELPYGHGVDNAHAFLTNAVISSFWCGWFSQARTNAGDRNFNPDHVEKYKEAIITAFEEGKKYARDRP